MYQQIQQGPEKLSKSNPSSVVGLSAASAVDQQQSALDTLAEVSRRHLDYSSHRGFVEVCQAHKASYSISEEDFIAQIREGAGLNTVAESSLDLYAISGPIQQIPQTTDVPLTSTSALASSPLIEAASAANQQLELAQAQSGSSVDPQLHSMGAPVEALLNGTDDVDNGADIIAWKGVTAVGPQSTFGKLSMPSQEDTAGFGVLQKPTKQKSRSHFNDTRRKEVHDIRKRGACIRCRMLKKPCSGETPCSTCRSVESARLWKGTCIRTRLAEEFDLWSTRLFYTKAKIEVSSAIYGTEPHSLSGHIEARFAAASDLCLTIAAKGYGKPEASSIWLLEENGSISDEIGAYATLIAEVVINKEPSRCMRSTLQKARVLVSAEDEPAEKAAKTDNQNSPRASYSLQNHLLSNVVELWVLTRLLASPNEHVLGLRLKQMKPSRRVPEMTTPSEQNHDSSVEDLPSSSRSYALIGSQLMATIESRCCKLSKTVMNELERRLLQRQQVSRFSTFLAAVILLNSVERMTGLYRAFDTGEQVERDSYPGQFTTKTDHTASDAENFPPMEAAWGNMSYRVTDHPNFWPLDTPPALLWPQGLHFAVILTMLLRMRALPPKTNQTPEGTLAVVQDYALPVRVNGTPLKERLDDDSATAAEWLNPLNLRVDELLEKRDGHLPGLSDKVEGWDMRFVAKVLLPERMK